MRNIVGWQELYGLTNYMAGKRHSRSFMVGILDTSIILVKMPLNYLKKNTKMQYQIR